MSFQNQNRAISWSGQEVKINNTTVSTLRSFSGGGWSIDAVTVYGSGKDPIDITEGQTTYEQITLEMLETEFTNIMDLFSGMEAARGSGTRFTLIRSISNGEQTRKYTYRDCRLISASPTLSQGPDPSTVSLVIQPLSAQLDDTFNTDLVGTLLGKAADFGGTIAGDVAQSLVGSLF